MPTPTTTPLCDLIETLHGQTIRPTGEELADALWLALRIHELSAMGGRQPVLASEKPMAPSNRPSVEPDSGAQLAERHMPVESPGSEQEQRLPIYVEPSPPPSDSEDKWDIGDRSTTGARSFRAPAAPALPNGLALGRALRPLMRRIPSRSYRQLDEIATAERFADRQAWLPAFKGQSECWLELAMVIDTSPSLHLWQPLLAELYRLLARQGAFRDVRRWYLGTDDHGQPVLSKGGDTPRRCPEELLHPEGRRLVMVVSDCAAAAWYTGAFDRWLQLWSRAQPLVLLHLLPPRFWLRGGLSRSRHLVRFRASVPGPPNSQLLSDIVERPADPVLLPVFTLEPESVALWARMLAGAGRRWSPGVVLDRAVTSLPPVLARETTDQERLRYFRQDASPEAQTLARYCSTVPLTLPIMRLLQDELLPESRQAHLAEVFFSGLLIRQNSLETDPDRFIYDFRSDLRTLLLDTLRAPQILEIHQRLSEAVRRNLGRSSDFLAFIPDLLEEGGLRLDARSLPFAKIGVAVLRRLGGHYRERAERLVQEIKDIVDIYDLAGRLTTWLIAQRQAMAAPEHEESGEPSSAREIWQRLQSSLDTRPGAREALNNCLAQPDDVNRQTELRDQLKMMLDDPQLAADLARLLKAVAGADGVTVGGNVEGDINNHNPPAPEPFSPALRDAYLRRVMARCGTLSLTGIDPAAAGQRDTDSQLRLNAVYTALLTRSPRQEEGIGLEPRTSKKRAEEELLRSALEQLDRQQRLVLQGDPGSGKSTFVNFVALCLAGEALQDEQANLRHLTAPLPDEGGKSGKKRQPWRHGALLPVPVVLRDFAATGLPKRGEASAETLWNFVAQELKAACQAECVDWLRHELREHGGLLLLDGLDEVPEAERRREQVKRAVEAFTQSFGKCRVLVTSRTYAYQNQGWRLQGFAEATLAPFSDGQIRRFVARWYELTADLGRLPASEAAGRAELLKRAIFNRPTLHELAQRPLLLTLMASLHAWRSGDLPEKREALYAETVDLLLNRWEQRLVQREAQGYRLIQPSLAEYLKTDKDQVRTVLEALAFEVHRAQPDLAGTADIAEDALIGRLLRLSANLDVNLHLLVGYLRDRAGVLYPRGVGVYTFPHRSFQEYLAACYLTDDDYPDKMADLARADPDRWREVALLAGAKAARGTAASLWQLVDTLCFREPTDPDVESADAWGAQIAAQALIETANLAKVGPANQRKLARVQQWLVKLTRDERLPATERALAGDNLAALGDPRFDAEHWHLPAEPLFGFVEIPAGDFKMGDDPHRVSLPGYYLARWPVTVAQFAAFVRDSGYESAISNCLKGIANHPVVWVSWHDALEYCRWLNEQLRKIAPERLDAGKHLSESERRFWRGLAEGSLGIGLPSEAELEKGARGTDGRIYPWGNEADPNRANYNETGLNGTSAVGCFPGGVSPYECEDLSGNVWEWTRSLFGDYPYSPESPGRQARENTAANDRRVLRGGAFNSNARNARCADRNHNNPDNRNDNNGFRVVASTLSDSRNAWRGFAPFRAEENGGVRSWPRPLTSMGPGE